MEKLYVDLGENSYNIEFSDSFSELPSALKEISAPSRLMIVTDSNVKNLYGDTVKNILINNGYSVNICCFEAGEKNKNMQTILDICSECINNGLDRQSMIIALGGGVVGDMAGFAAAIYMRGIKFVQIPTTLLSQSDSSVGGKTGIDFQDGKNILGAFHQPELVYINVTTLKTLPKKEFISGMGEVIKHGIIRDAVFFDFLYNNTEKIKELDIDTLIYMAKTNCSIKADIVMNDEKENGIRAILNFGHTIGHAVESACDFKKTHGQCVGFGIICASYIALGRSIISKKTFESICDILRKYDFETGVYLPDNEAVWTIMQKDKKKVNDTLKFILPLKIGDAGIKTDISKSEVFSSLDFIKCM